MKYIYIISILFFVSFSCSRKKEAPGDTYFEMIHMADGTTWNDSHVSINGMVATDSVLWINSEQGENSIIYAYSLDGNFIAKGIAYGRGPGEVLEITSLHPTQNGDVALYDGKAGKVHRLIIREYNIHSDCLKDSLFFYDDVVMLPNERIVTLPMNSPNSYILSNLNGNAIDSLSYFPPKPKAIDDNTHILACTGSLAVSLNGKSMARAIAYDGGLDFFSIDSNQMSHRKRFSLFNMNYSTLDGGVKVPIPNNDSKTGYSFLCSTNKHIYASYSETKVLDNPDGVCKEIHVFDHNGNPKYKLLLDRAFSSFTVTSNDQSLFVACDIDGKAVVIEYNLAEKDL